jgi:hypothetical protein
MLKVTHRHVVMGIPGRFWPLFHENPILLKALMKTAFETVQETMRIYTGRPIVPGALVVVHVFGKDLKQNVHIHMLMTEGGYDSDTGEWVPFTYLPFQLKGKVNRTINMIWRDNFFEMWYKQMAQTPANRTFIETWRSKYPNGFYIYSPSKSRVPSSGGVHQRVKYITRYMKHPVISDSRIVSFTGDRVRFWYDESLPNGKKKRVFVTLDGLDFVHNVLRHVPAQNFRSTNCYGLYSNRRIGGREEYTLAIQMKLNLTSSGPCILSPESYEKIRWKYCRRCGEELYVVAYVFLDKKEYSYKVHGYYPDSYPTSKPDLSQDEVTFPDSLLSFMLLVDMEYSVPVPPPYTQSPLNAYVDIVST